MADIKDWTSLATPDPEWQEAVKKLGRTPDLGAFSDVTQMRQWFIEAKRSMTATFPQIPGVTEKDHQISTRDGSQITARVYTPDSKSGCPLVIAFHGGGWCIGGLENEEMYCRNIVSKLGCIAVNVEYRLAPEYKFPTAVHDAHDATKWVIANASSLGADLSQGFIVGGTSAGAGLAADVAHLARDEGLQPPITGCHLTVPPLCDHAHFPDKYKGDLQSWEQNKNAPILSRAAITLFSDAYIPNKEDRKSELWSPLLWPSGHKNFPATYFQICGLDPLRDEGLVYERILREEEGVKTKVDVYPGQPHGFATFAPSISASKKFVQDSISGVKWLLDDGQQTAA